LSEPDRTGRSDRSNREPDLHPVRVSRKTGLRMNRSLNRKTGRKPGKTGKNRPKPEKTGLKKLLIFLIEKI
jgi:hypothetical protein